MIKRLIIASSVLFSSFVSAQYVIKFENSYSKGFIPKESEVVSYANCKEILDAGESSGDGLYTVNPVNAGEFEAYCDMTTAGGGWTRIIDNGSSLESMKKFGDTSEIENTFYTDNVLGVGWGTNDNTYKNFSIAGQFSEMYIQYSGYYDVPAGGLGYLRIGDDQGSALYFNDSHTSSTQGQSLKLNGITIFEMSQTNLSNRTDILSVDSHYQVSMKGYTSNYAYTKRYINNLWIR